MKIVIVSGGFDPVHAGHIQLLNGAAELGDYLVVGLNSDAWLGRKKGRAFMSWNERQVILQNLHMTDEVIAFDDSDETACGAIQYVKQKFPNAEIIFANGGDRTQDNIPEMVFDDIKFVFGVGGTEKTNSSSWILSEWKAPKTERPWGYYRVLHEDSGTKVKELTVESGKKLSLQKHTLRNEYWIVTHGKAVVHIVTDGNTRVLNKHDTIVIPKEQWHRLENPFSEPCRIVEIQYGSNCIESDIERLPV